MKVQVVTVRADAVLAEVNVLAPAAADKAFLVADGSANGTGFHELSDHVT